MIKLKAQKVKMNSVLPDTLAMSTFFFLVFSFSLSHTSPAHKHEDFLQCVSFYQPEDNNSISKVTYTPKNSSYSSVLQFSIRNLRFNTSTTPKPVLIVTPTKASHIQASIFCSKKIGLQIRVRSGGHDYEGLSYTSTFSDPFIVLDLINFRNITVDVASKTAWVQSGATLGELYYRIGKESKTLAFPAGTFPSVGVGGQFSGGGYGFSSRKFGQAADNVIDAILIDVDGRILDRVSMGEDHFWAIRGGGGNTFGVVIAWKINLLEIPPIVTVFQVQRTLEQDALELVNQWQYIADKLPDELFITVQFTRVNTTEDGNTTIIATFDSLYLGRVHRLLLLMQENFPELGVVKEDCTEMSWIESTLYTAGFTNYTSLDQLLNRVPSPNLLIALKVKSDFARKPIPEAGLKGLFQLFYKIDVGAPSIFLFPFGGRMNEISDSSIPFPYRAGYIYLILYTIDLTENSKKRLDWIGEIYKYMAPYVSKNPRAAYVNDRDLDIGVNNQEYTSYAQARIWGEKYFGKNFNRLVKVKTIIDPTNIFRNEQSVPPFWVNF